MDVLIRDDARHHTSHGLYFQALAYHWIAGRWRHATGPSGSYFSCASRILRSITARRRHPPAAVSASSPAATASPKRCCSKALNAYRLNTRISVWSRLTSRRSSSRRGGYPPGRTSASAPPRSPAPHRGFSGPGGRRSHTPGGGTGITQYHTGAPQHEPALNIAGIILQAGAQPQRQPRHLLLIQRLRLRVQRPRQQPRRLRRRLLPALTC